jgi:hypothetical protein
MPNAQYQMSKIMTLKKLMIGLIVAALVSTCKDAEKLLTFRINDSTSIRIESSSPLNLPLGIPTPAVTSNSQQQYENNNTSKNLVKDVQLEELKLTITDPPSKTFSFLKSIHIYISTDQSDEIELASLENVSTNVNVVNLTPTKEKLDVYAKAPSYSLRTEVETDEALTQPVDIQVDLRFVVTADTF